MSGLWILFDDDKVQPVRARPIIGLPFPSFFIPIDKPTHLTAFSRCWLLVDTSQVGRTYQDAVAACSAGGFMPHVLFYELADTAAASAGTVNPSPVQQAEVTAPPAGPATAQTATASATPTATKRPPNAAAP